ncbi:MAG: beta-propeller domain-containing protein, partial [Microthrixaceae bacterium]
MGPTHRIRRTTIAGLLVLVTALLGACTVDGPGPGPGIGTGEGPVGLVRAGSCEALRELSARVAVEDRGGAAIASAEGAPTTSAAAGRVVAGTNVQEAGVDESDLVATDGRRIVAVSDGVLRVVDLDGTPAVDGRLDLRAAGATELLLDGDRALVVGENGEVTLTLVDLAADGGPRVLRQRSVEGSLVAVRRHDGTTRVVVRSYPTPAAPMPLAEGAPLGECRDVLVPEGATAALDMAPAGRTTVLSPDPELEDLRPVTVEAPADAVYASPTSLYVAGATWDATGPRTAVHRFDLSGDGPARYTGSGSVEGTLLDRYSLSEERGDLRVVTTVQPSAAFMPAGPDGADANIDQVVPVTRGRLTVLRPGADGTLDEVGRLDGLGPNEAVQAVRFMGERAYVVTFRRTDPLFALDLADPTAPRVLGELKIPGFSEYLHPVGDGRLLGVGSDADPATGAVTGAKISLFDVSDPAAPRELDALVVPGARSEVADEPRAFTWDP